MKSDTVLDKADDTVPDILDKEEECLVKVNNNLWERKILCVKKDQIVLMNTDTMCVEISIHPSCCLGVKISTENLVTISACPRLKGDRKFLTTDIEFGNHTVAPSLVDFMKNYSYIPAKRKKVLVLINPASGKGRATKIWDKVSAMTANTGTEFEVFLTQRAGHAKEILHDLDLDQYGGVVTVSGDGGLYDITNGLFSRPDWKEVHDKFPIGLVPGGSGHAMHCSLLFHQQEKFDQEYEVSALNIGRGNLKTYDYIECSTKSSTFVSLFGVAWGVIPEVDVGSEFMRFLGPSRGRLLGIWRLIFPRFHEGTVYYKPYVEQDNECLPKMNEPVPDSWKSIEGPFLNVYACKQPWLDYEMFFCPEAKPDDGIIWLVIIMGTINRKDSIYWLLNGETSGHLKSQHTMICPITAFRFVPSEGVTAPMTVDAELLRGGMVQGIVRRSGVNIMVM